VTAAASEIPDLADLRLLATGRTAEVYALDRRRVLKVLRPGFPDRMAEVEAEVARRVLSVYDAAPGCDGFVRAGGRAAIVYERIDGPTMDGRLRTHPWQIGRLGRRLGELHAGMHERQGTGFREQRPALHDAIERAEQVLPRDLAAAAHRRVDELPTGSRLCHGDLHPGNVLLGPRLVVIDWENVRAGNPAADVARSVFLLGDSAMPDSLPGPMATLAGAIRRAVTRAYLAGYRSVRPLDSAELTAWRLPILAARLAEGIAEERLPLTAAVEGLVRGA
jgi:Ser/Thr protein kinase RdoA (MazF antagonist)